MASQVNVFNNIPTQLMDIVYFHTNSYIHFAYIIMVAGNSVKVKGKIPVTQSSTKATAATKDVDMVRYTSESVQISPNAATVIV